MIALQVSRRGARALAALLVLTTGLVATTVPPVAAAEGEYLHPVGGSFVSVGPSRLVDTREVGQGPCVTGERVVAVPGVPAGAGGVVLNVTVTGAKSPGFVSVYAAGSVRPPTSVLNFSKAATVENSVTTAVGAGGIALFASGGCPHVIVDLLGYYTPGEPARGGSFASIAPSRLVDTRKAGQGPCVSGARTVAVPGVPEGAGGVIVNVTVTGARSQGFASVHAAGSVRPATSVLNFAAGQTVANGATTAVGTSGLTVFASGGCPHVIVDLVGSFTGEAPVLEGSFVGVPPSRLVDTRKAGQGPCVSGARTVAVPGVPEGATGVVVNVTVTGAKAPGYVSTYAAGATRPSTSTLNFAAGRTSENGATTALGEDGITVFASGGCPHVIVDLVGWFTGEPELLTGVVDVATGGSHSCALLDDGDVRCWGHDDRPMGENGLGDHIDSSAFPVPVPGLDAADRIEAGLATSCAVLVDTTVSCWGWDLREEDWGGSDGPTGIPPMPIGDLAGITDVGVGDHHACALRDDGTVWCWGFYEALGREDGSDSPIPLQVPGLDDVVEIDSGTYGMCSLSAAGNVHCWGFPFESTPQPVETIADPISVSVGSGHACAGLADGTVQCWGDLRPLLVGGSADSDPVPVPGLADVVQVESGQNSTCVRTTNGEIDCIGSGLVLGGPLYSQVPLDAPVRMHGLGAAAQDVSARTFHGCAVIGGGQVRCWGWNAYGMLGNGTMQNSTTPVTVIRGIES